MPTVEDILGAAPSAEDLLGPSPAKQAALAKSTADMGAAWWNRADDSMELGARNAQAEADFQRSYPEMLRLGIVKPNPDFNVAKNEAPAQVGVDVPLFNLGDFMLKDPQDAKSPAEAGVIDTLRPTLNGLTSPKNLALMLGSMGVATTGMTAARLVSALWAAWMGKNAVEDAPVIGAELGKEFAKPEGERDQRRIAQLLTQGGVDAAFVALPAAHAAAGVPGSTGADLAAKLDEAVRSTEFPQPSETLPENAPVTRMEQPAGEPSPGPHRIQYAEDVLGPKPKLSATIEPPKAEPRSKPEVPETPAEPYETVLEAIRKAGAQTIGQIQDLFPARELTREEARALRDQAWTEEYKQQQQTKGNENESSQNEEPKTGEVPNVVGKPVEPEPEGQVATGVEERPGEGATISPTRTGQEEPARGGSNPVERAEGNVYGATPRWLSGLPKTAKPLAEGAESGDMLVRQLWNEYQKGNRNARTLLGPDDRSLYLRVEDIREQIREYPNVLKRAVEEAKGRSATVTEPEPKRGGANPVERAEAARPWDLIDEVQGNVGGLSLASAKKLDPDWSPTGAARNLFKEGGQSIDQAAEAIRRSGVAKLAKDEDLLYELDKAAAARKIWRKDFYEGEQAAEEQARGQEQFEKDVAKWKRPHDAVVADELMPGDEFELQGEKVKVKQLDFDEHGDVTHVTLEDGTKYGTVQVPAGTVIRMDPKSLEKVPAEPDWNPEAGVAESRALAPAAARKIRQTASIERGGDTFQFGIGDTVDVWLDSGKRSPSIIRGISEDSSRVRVEPVGAVRGGTHWVEKQRIYPTQYVAPPPKVRPTKPLSSLLSKEPPGGFTEADRVPTFPKTPPPSGQAGIENARPEATVSEVLGKEPAKTAKPPVIAESRPIAQALTTERILRGREQEQNGATEAGKQLEQTAATPPAKQWFRGLRNVFAPTTIDDSARTMGGIIRHALGKEYESMRQADFQLRKAQKEFDRTPVGRKWTYDPNVPLPRNYEVMRAIDTGDVKNLTPMEQQFAGVMRRLFDEAIEMVQKVSPNSLRELIQNYFPRIWKDPEKQAAVINSLLSKKPWEGPKSFLKQRVLEYFTDGLRTGLRPVSDNPVDVALMKLGEMYRFAATRMAMEEAKARGLLRFRYAFEERRPGWRAVNDSSSTRWAPPVVTIKEAYDAQMRAATLEFLQQMGIPHERLAKIGGQRWGYAEQGTGKIVSKFAGPDSVIWHEMGHQMDWRYPELRRLLGATSPNSKIGKQLRALADLRSEGEEVTPGHRAYLRSAEEKMANVFEAYLHVPERFKQVAPDVLNAFEGWLNEHPEVKNPLKQIKPSLVLKEGDVDMFLGGPVRLGEWEMPEGAAQVVDNYLTPGLGRYKAFRSLREVSGLLNGVQLLGFFHGQFVMNDSFYSGLGLAAYDVLQKKPMRALKELLQVPISPITSAIRGHKIKAAIENPAAANAEYQQIAKLAVEQNLRAGHGNFDPEFSRRWVRVFHEALSEPSAGAAWETLWRAPMAAMQLGMKPVMDLLVPRMKLGIYARMAARVLEDYGTADPEILRRKLAEAADATEDRLGQVTYDNLFQSRAVKDAGQLAMRAYGWQLTKYRMIGGGIADWVRAANAMVKGQKPDVTFRMTYLPAMALGHAIIGGIVGYALTGKRPEKLIDYMFPKSGAVDAQGNPVRLSIADFVKDVIADAHGLMTGRVLEEWSRKLAPFWNMAAEMYRNEDFWSTRIFSEKQLGEPALEHLLKNVKEGAEYMGRTAVPFSVTSGQRMAQTSKNPALAATAPFFGIVPAPRYATQTAAEARASDITRDALPRGARTRGEAKHAQNMANLVQDIRLGKISDEGEFERRARAAGVKDDAERKRIQQRVQWTPLQYQVYKMPLEKDASSKAGAMAVFDLATEQEKASLAPILAEKIQRAWEADKLDDATAKRYVALVKPWYRARR